MTVVYVVAVRAWNGVNVSAGASMRRVCPVCHRQMRRRLAMLKFGRRAQSLTRCSPKLVDSSLTKTGIPSPLIKLFGL